MLRRVALLLCLGCLVRVHAAEAFLTLLGAGPRIELTAAEFAALPHIEIKTAVPRQSAERTYSGVPMRELLQKLGAPLGEKLRGPALQQAVLVRCRDNYAVLFALAEFDDAFSSRELILADREDGQPGPATAPLRLIVPGDKHGGRWARGVAVIELVNVGPKP